ncbi:MAG TPA: prepilin peptidase [Longimicrobiaceae bacterium]|nr:prepilin peptidase [Longimicrobiaceae bacterium]
MPDWYLYLIAGILGAMVGSFLNVCIYRLPANESVVSPGSHCPECDTPIGWRDNIPIISYLWLRGRCRNCGTGISVQYPLIELVTGLIWVASVARYGLDWQALSTAVFFTLLLGIALTDARTYIIPDEFSLGGLVIGLGLAAAPGGISFPDAAFGAAAGFGFLYVAGLIGQWWLKKPAMGGGDIKMMAMVGAFLGPMGALLTIFLGALVGTLIFLPISIRTKKLVPFGIFLAIGAAVTEAFGDAIIAWYTATFLLG